MKSMHLASVGINILHQWQWPLSRGEDKISSVTVSCTKRVLGSLQAVDNGTGPALTPQSAFENTIQTKDFVSRLINSTGERT